MNISALAAAADLDHYGSWDYAVPYQWLMEDPEARRENLWFYPAKGNRSMFGRPLSWRVLARLALRRMRRTPTHDFSTYAQLWAYLHPGKPLDLAGLTIAAAYLATFSDGGIADWNLDYLLRHFGIPQRTQPTRQRHRIHYAAA